MNKRFFLFFFLFLLPMASIQSAQAQLCEFDADCDDSIACTIDICNLATNECSNEPDDFLCEDNNSCTTDTCDPGAGCLNEPINCSDGDNCTEDICEDGVCLNPEKDCSDGNACTADVCQATTGLCQNDPIVCNDDIDCTDDSCNPAAGCIFEPLDDNCDDSNECTRDICDPVGGCQFVDTSQECDDNDLCTEDSCDQAVGCVFDVVVVCDDNDTCTEDICEPATGECEFIPTMGACGHEFCGRGRVNWIELSDSNQENDVPAAPCVLWFDFDLFNEDGQVTQHWNIFAEAFGTQLNQSLLKAHNFDEEISICFEVNFDKSGYNARIKNVDFGEDPPAPPAPGTR